MFSSYPIPTVIHHHKEKHFNRRVHKRVMKTALPVIACLVMLAAAGIARGDVTMAYFYADDCALCDELQPFMEELDNLSYVTVESYKISSDPYYPNENDSILANISYAYHAVDDVPLVFLANQWFYFGVEGQMERIKENLLAAVDELKEYEVENPVENGKLNYPKPVSVLLFYNSSKHEDVEPAVSALEENITFIRIDRLDINEQDNRELFQQLNQSHTPVAIIGEYNYSLDDIPYLVAEAEKYENIGIDFPAAYEEKPICVVFFYKSTCSSCLSVKAKLEALAETYPLRIAAYDITESKNNDLLLAYYDSYNITRPHTTNIFIGDRYFYSESHLHTVENIIREHLGAGLECPKAGEANAEKLLEGYTLLTVIFGGLLDGINPCAFATLVFFIAYLERARKEAILPIGLSFSAGIYIAYLMIGIGLLEFLHVVQQAVSRYLYFGVGVMALILGAFSITDFFAIRKGKTAVLQLPLFLKKRRGRIIKHITEDRRITVLALVACIVGFAISALEFACTGQVLIPVITVIQGATSSRAIGILYLVIYTAFFILPLLLILALFHMGYSSARIGEMQKKSYGYAKLLIGIFLLSLGIIMILYFFGFISLHYNVG